MPNKLAKELKPKEIGHELFKDGQFLGYEDVKVLTEEELNQRAEQIAREEAIDEITAQKKPEVLKRLKEGK